MRETNMESLSKTSTYLIHNLFAIEPSIWLEIWIHEKYVRSLSLTRSPGNHCLDEALRNAADADADADADPDEGRVYLATFWGHNLLLRQVRTGTGEKSWSRNHEGIMLSGSLLTFHWTCIGIVLPTVGHAI